MGLIMDAATTIRAYLTDLNKKLATGDASEHSHRPALKTMLEAMETGLNVINEPKRIACGAPDLRVMRGGIPVGYIETKDIGKNLDEAARSDQLKRYRESLPNLILTDYLEFRWYVGGERRETVRVASMSIDGKIHSTHDGIQAVSDLVQKFLAEEPPVIGRPKELASHMAKLAHLIRISIEEALKQESETGNLHGQLKAFQDTLIPDLKPDQFADMYAQTIAYGLFAAWEPFPDNKRFTRQEAAWNLPKTNPFLRKLFNDIAGIGLDDRVAWLADDLAFLVNRADKVEVLRDFGKVTKQEDPVVHFYEDFLKAYDPKMRKARGVYYTPEPVVSYIVRSIDYLLKTKFNKPWGLADKDVMILDPACGTGTFLYFVIQEIYDTLKEKGQLGGWNDYVKNHLLPRIFGFELLMAPYTVAHMKLGMLLKKLGYDFTGDQRLEIYLTNSLGETVTKGETKAAFKEYIAEEGVEADAIKRDKRIMVVLGNPPYSVSSVNKGEQIEKLMVRYKKAVRGERNIQPLSDDYIKFIRFAHDRIERTGYGIIGMITNNSYLSGLIHRGMREELLRTFDEIYILNLHGNSLIGETTPEGGKDENVFDIRQGVGISILTKKEKPDAEKVVRYEDLWGVRDGKYKYLFSDELETTEWHKIGPSKTMYFFVPVETGLLDEYEKGISVSDIFTLKSDGVTTHRDVFIIDFSKDALLSRISSFCDLGIGDDEIREKFELEDTSGWKLEEARKKLSSIKDLEQKVIRYLYRPFDERYIFYSKDLIDRPRYDVMKHLTERNIALLVMRQVVLGKGYTHYGVSRNIADKRAFLSNRGGVQVLPLYVYKKHDYFGDVGVDEEVRVPNLSPEFITAMEGKLGMKFVPEVGGTGFQPVINHGQDAHGTFTFGPDDVLHYIYAIFHSPTYRTRYQEFLKIDFPRVPLTSDRELFRRLCGLGEELVGLHLMESPRLQDLVTTFSEEGTNVVDEWRYVEVHGQDAHATMGRVYINKTQYFEGIDREVWEFHIGGYQVLQKWLKDRKGRPLDWDKQQHYQKIVVALKETIRLMGEIDGVILEWPIA